MRRLCAGSVSSISLTLLNFLTITQISDAIAITPFSSPRQLLSRVQRAWRRDTTPSAISIAPSQYWEGNDGPWASFPLQVGTGAVGGLQNVRVMISTAATAIWTVGPGGCPPDYVANCDSSRGELFLSNQSLTWTPNSAYETGLESNLGLDSSGYVGYDKATLGWQGSGGPTDDHSIIWTLSDSEYWLGVFGLNPRPTNFTTFTNPQASFMQTLANNMEIPSVSWAYTAGNQYRLDKVYGSLTMGGYDTNRFTPNDVTFDFYPDISRDLSVNLHSISTSKGSPSNLLPGGSISIFIDSTVPELWLPASACAAFEDAFSLKFNTDFNRYIITSSQRQQLLAQGAEVTFTIGPTVDGGKTVDIVLPYQAFDLQVQYPIVTNPNTSYYFPLQKAANDTQYTLGRTFLQEAYLIADYERQNFSVSQCAWDRKKLLGQNLVTILSPDAANKTSSGDSLKEGNTVLSTVAIVSVAVGIGGLIAILSLILFLLHRKKLARKRKAAEIEAEKAASSKNSASKLEISGPMGGELCGAEIVEMPHHGKEARHEMQGPYNRDPNRVGYSEMQGQEYFGPGQGFATEMPGHVPIYEMLGSDVQELPNGRRSRLSRASGGWI